LLNYLLLHKFRFKILGPIQDEARLARAESFYRKQGFKTFRVNKPPSRRLIEIWSNMGVGRASDGCWTKGLSSCEHSHRAWTAIYRDLVK
jgi:hypothetical protein